MKEIKQQLAEELSTVLEVEVAPEDIESPEGEHGDFAYPVMKAASALGEPPRELAEDVSDEVELDIVERVEVAGPGYLNFFLDREQFAEEVFEELEREEMGVEQHDGKMLIEFSSPNVAKPMHVGHFRNNALGDSLQRILRFAGYDVTSENYLGDWGTQYGKLIYAFREYGSEEQFEEAPMEHMFDLYVRFHEEAEEDEEIEEKGREWAAKIEEGDEEARELWERFRDASIEYHRKDYRRMGIDFDRWTGESKVVEEARDMVEGWLEEGELERDDDGSVFMEFEEHDLPGTVLLKADGSTLYITRDLYNLKKRNQEGFDHNLYVVGSEQELHFQQVFAAAEELGLDPEGSEHVSYGLLSLPEGSMSSRAGRIIRLEDAMDEAVERAEEKAAEKMEREVENAEAIGIGALKYANLSVSRKKDIEFDWDRALSFEGDSGPYLQYSNVRAKSILEKADAEGQLQGELEDAEYRLLKKLGGFPEKVDAAAREREPAKIANYLSSLCEEFNSFYHDCPVIDAGEETRMRRLALVELFARVTDQGLELLGIEPLEEM
ncbi:MAG: arginine--tRNA ligase [Candidatus Nanohaloarchaea archaeon]